MDTYFPLTARRLGDDWVSDKLTFAEVTLALGHLQLLNAKFEPIYLSATDASENHPRILVLVPEGEDHTFGAISATRMFRRLQTKTILALGYNKSELEKLILENDFDLIGLSAGNNFMSDEINRLSAFLKTKIKTATPIVLGGNLTKTYKLTNEPLKVDLISSDPDYVLEQTGLTKKTLT